MKTNCRGYLNLAAAGEFEKAWELALDPNPMASICGSVCAAPCETACRRKEVDKPLSIRYVKKFLSDWTHQNVRTDGRAYTQPPPPSFGPARGRVAVVGIFTSETIPIPAGIWWARALDVRFAGVCPVHAWWELALAEVRSGRIDPAPIISHRLALEDAAEGYALFDARRATKVLLIP